MSAFISYRRNDAGGHTAFLAARLVERYGRDRIFLDTRSIKAGAGPWRRQLDAELARCRVVLAVVGPDWLDQLRVRLDDPATVDVVRYELTEARRRGTVVVPVRVGGAELPLSQLPDDLSWLAGEQFIDVVADQPDDGHRRVFEALDRALPLTARRRNRVVLAMAATAICTMVTTVVVLRAAKPCWFEECLPRFEQRQTAVILGPPLEVRRGSDPSRQEIAKEFASQLVTDLQAQLGDDVIVAQLSSDQLDVPTTPSGRDATAASVLEDTNADLLVIGELERTGGDPANRTTYRADLYLGSVRDAEDLAGTRLSFAAVTPDRAAEPNDVAEDDDTLRRLADEVVGELEIATGLLGAMSSYENRNLVAAAQQLSEVLTLVEEADADSADAALLYHLRGNVHVELGSLEQAREDYDRADSYGFARSSLGLAEVDLVAAHRDRCSSLAAVGSLLASADKQLERVARTAAQRDDSVLAAKTEIAMGRVDACRSNAHASDPAKQRAIGDSAIEHFRRARDFEGETPSDVLREPMSIAGVAEARLRIQRAVLLDERAAAAELDAAVELLVGESGAANRTNREWLAGEAYELLATVEDFRRNPQAAAEARRHGCARYREVELGPRKPDYPGDVTAAEARAAIDRLCQDQIPSD